jgi:transcriptional regulator with XRE-family HTH domain
MDEPKPMRELTRIREERGLSQQGLADVSGVNKATINQIERGRRSPNLETLEKLAGALAVEMADFFPKAQAPLPLEEFAAGAHVWEKVLNAARQDAEKNTRALNLFASEGVMRFTNVGSFAEDEVRAELRNLGFPDALWEPLLWPLVQRIVELEQQLVAKEGKPKEHLESHTRTRQ